ncbi:MAG TPA: HD domain-containing phosphohydrolase [Gaiellaceae bacterium]|nr:HD domain-containing phosphohydrolase [Gaiellaceae bacterium]
MSGESILCVDDDVHVRRLIERMIAAAGYRCVSVGSVDEARRLLAGGRFVLVLCDINLPGRSGLVLLAELAGRAPEVATLMVTGRDEPELADATIQQGAYGYVTKPFSQNALLIEVANALHRRRLELERRMYEIRLEETVAERTAELEEAVRGLELAQADLRRSYRETLLRLGRAIEYHDLETGAHVERVGNHAGAIALALGLDPEWAELLRLAAPLHDVGKLAVTERILIKDGELTRAEIMEMRRHAELGHDLLAGSGNELLDLAATVAWTHHERWNGGGYPCGLADEAIPLEGRIVAVADVFDALTSDRPYRRRLEVPAALAYLADERGREFDPEVVEAFLRSIDADFQHDSLLGIGAAP